MSGLPGSSNASRRDQIPNSSSSAPDESSAADDDALAAAADVALGAGPDVAAGASGSVTELAPGALPEPGGKARHVRLATFLMVGALCGKLLGFLREIEIARLLGASFVADSFRGALTATLMPITPMQGDMSPSVLIPLHRQWKSEGISTPYFTSLMVVFACISVTITVLVWSFAGWWVDIVVGGFGPEAHAVTVEFVRIMALAMPASTLSSNMGCIEISVGRSRITTIRASVSNVGIMIGIGVMAYTGHPIAIAWGYVIAFNVVMLYGGYKLVQEGEIALSAVRWPIMKAAMRAFFKRMRPLFVQPFADQGNTLLERFLGSTFAVGTLASLDYARTLTETALYLVSQPIGYVMLAQPPGEESTIRSRVSAISRPLLGLGMPAALFLCLYAPDIVSLVFQRGRFQEQAVMMTAGSLQGISVGLWASTLGWVLLRMVNAMGRNGAAARVIICSYIGNSVVNVSLWMFASVGGMGLGLGEATRGVVTLFGASLALGCGKLILSQAAKLLPCLLLLTGASIAIRYGIDRPLLRLALGGVVFGIGTGLTLRAEFKALYHKIQTRRRTKKNAVLAVGRL